MQRLLPVAIAVAILAGLLGGVLASPGSAGSSAATCIYGGVRYVGTTSQKADICFTLTPKGKIMREYAFDYADTCGTGTMRALNPRAGVVPVLPTGVFCTHHDRRVLQGHDQGRQGIRDVPAAQPGDDSRQGSLHL